MGHGDRYIGSLFRVDEPVPDDSAPKSQDFVDYRIHKTGKMLPHVKFSSKRSDFLRFYLYLLSLNDNATKTYTKVWRSKPDETGFTAPYISSPQGFVIRAEGLCGFQIRSYITRGLTNCLPPSRLTSLNIGCTRHSQASLTLLSFARYFGITQTSLTLSSSVTTRDSPSKLGLSSRCSIGWLLLSLLRRLQIPVNTKNNGRKKPAVNVMFNYPIDNVGGKTGIANPREPKLLYNIFLLFISRFEAVRQSMTSCLLDRCL